MKEVFREIEVAFAYDMISEHEVDFLKILKQSENLKTKTTFPEEIDEIPWETIYHLYLHSSISKQ